MKIIKTSPGGNLFLGHQGEKLALRVVFDIKPWQEAYGFGTAHLLHQRNGDQEPYPVATVQEGSEVRWDVSDGDTAVDGYGKYELRFYEGETLVKSCVGETYVRKALQYGAEPPEPVQLWLDRVIQEESKIYQAVTDSEAAKTGAEAAAGAAVAAAGNAAVSELAAQTAQRETENAKTQAAESAKSAAESAEEARKAAESVGGSGITVTAKPGQLIRVKEVDESGNPTAWEAFPHLWVEEQNVILEETDAVESTDPTYGKCWIVAKEPMLTVGETYTVIYNGAPYDCVCLDAGALINGAVALGNASVIGGIDTGEPFAMLIAPQPGIFCLDLTGAESVRIGILGGETIHPIPGKFLPEGVPYVGSDMTELPIVGEWTDDGGTKFIYATAPIGLEVGKSYVVQCGGTEYQVVAQETVVEILSVVYVGNIGLLGGAASEEPFLLAELPGGMNGVYAMGVLVGAEPPIAIYEPNVHKLDNRCLDMDYVKQELNVSGDTIKVNLADIGLEVVGPGTTHGTVQSGNEDFKKVIASILAGSKVELTFQYNFGSTEKTHHAYVSNWNIDSITFGEVSANLIFGSGNVWYAVKVHMSVDMQSVRTGAYKLTLDSISTTEV